MFEFLFSFHGRSGRLSYAFFFLFWVFLFILAFVGFVFMSLLSPLIMVPLVFGLFIAMWISSLAITVRRLHDMDLSGWVILVPTVFALFLVAGAVAAQSYGYDFDPESADGLFPMLEFGLSVFTYVFYLMLLLWPGSKDINRFEA